MPLRTAGCHALVRFPGPPAHVGKPYEVRDQQGTGLGRPRPPLPCASFHTLSPTGLPGPGACSTSALIRIETVQDDGIGDQTDARFEAESMVVSRVVADHIVVAAEFPIDCPRHARGLLGTPQNSDRRVCHVVQGRCEIETCKAMATPGLALARSNLGSTLDARGAGLSTPGESVAGTRRAEESLDALLRQLRRIRAHPYLASAIG